MKLTSLTDTEIFLKLGDLSSGKGVLLRFSDKQFYVSLLHLCEEIGEFDKEENTYFVQLSISSFMKTLAISSHTVQRALKLLSECGVIKRVAVKQFRKISLNEVKLNKPYRTYVNCFYLNKEEKSD